MAADGTEQQLSWEARQRPRAGIAALLAGLLTLIPTFVERPLFSDAPRGTFLQSLENVLKPGPIGSQTSLRTAFWEWYVGKEGELLVLTALSAIALIAIGWALSFLAAATRARKPELLKAAIYLPIVGGVLSAVSTLLVSLGRQQGAHDFLAGPHTVDRSREVFNDSLIVAGQIIGLPGSLALAGGFVLIALNAMRVGLLTRFWGILGVIVGVLIIVPIGVQIVQPVWLIGLGLLLLGRWPQGVPPAWRTGRAEPWPTSAEIAAARREQAVQRGGGAKAAPAPAENGGGGSRRKRKRRS